MTNLILGILLAKGLLKQEEAEELASSLGGMVVSHDTRLAFKQIQSVFDDLERTKKKKKEK